MSTAMLMFFLPGTRVRWWHLYFHLVRLKTQSLAPLSTNWAGTHRWIIQNFPDKLWSVIVVTITWNWVTLLQLVHSLFEKYIEWKVRFSRKYLAYIMKISHTAIRENTNKHSFLSFNFLGLVAIYFFSYTLHCESDILPFTNFSLSKWSLTLTHLFILFHYSICTYPAF